MVIEVFIMIDKRMLVHTVKISKLNGLDEWGKPNYGRPETFNPVRFDRKLSLNKFGKDDKISKRGTVYVYPFHAKANIDSSYLNALVDDGRETYQVIDITTEYFPFKNEVFCYELDVI